MKIMALDERYFTSIELQEYLVNKDTGAPLANGKIKFYQDTSRIAPKAAFTLVGTPPAYTYEPLPNPLRLSSVGTAQDDDGNDISIYFYPYDEFGNLQLYYIVITDENDIPQFTRQAWPNITAADDPTVDFPETVSNQISNSQFVDVLFDAALGMNITIAGAGTNVYAIAPSWDLMVTTTGASTVGVTRTSVQGSSKLPGNPPYVLNVNAGANISLIQLRQRLFNNPDIFAPSVEGVGGFLSASILLDNGTSAQVIYAPSVGTAQTVLQENNISGAFAQFDNTVQLDVAANTQTSNVGYVDILIKLSIAGASGISNVQIASLSSNEAQIKYEQETVNRQKDHLFHYYNPLLSYRPVPSYLCGWDFPLNPSQFLGPTIPVQAVGANKSFYAWDQTIVFQSVNNGVSVSRGANGQFVLTCAVEGAQCAIIQYLDQTKAREILNSKISCAIESKTSNVAGIDAAISLYYGTGGALPSVAGGTNNSLVATLNANGIPATFNSPGGLVWSSVTRASSGSDNNSARFTVVTNTTTNFNFNGFNGWDLKGVAGTATANWFAIVVGFAPMTLGDTISINSVSVVPGEVPCRPAPQSETIALADCQFYYQKSFTKNIVPATQTLVANGVIVVYGYIIGAASYASDYISFYRSLRATPTLTIYNPVNNNSNFYNITAAADTTAPTIVNTSTQGFGYQIIGGADGLDAFNWTADARLGIV